MTSHTGDDLTSAVVNALWAADHVMRYVEDFSESIIQALREIDGTGRFSSKPLTVMDGKSEEDPDLRVRDFRIKCLTTERDEWKKPREKGAYGIPGVSAWVGVVFKTGREFLKAGPKVCVGTMSGFEVLQPLKGYKAHGYLPFLFADLFAVKAGERLDGLEVRSRHAKATFSMRQMKFVEIVEEGGEIKAAQQLNKLLAGTGSKQVQAPGDGL